MVASCLRVILICLYSLGHCHCESTGQRCVHDCGVSNSLANAADPQSTEYPEITEEEIRRELLRIEGQRILEKLRLDKPPELRRSFHDLPAPVSQRVGESALMEEAAMDAAEDAPGRLRSIYVLGERPRRGRGRTHLCKNQRGKPATCIDFEINGKSLANNPVLQAALWVNLYLDDKQNAHSADDNTDDRPTASFALSVFALRNHGQEEPIAANVDVVASTEGNWVSLNVTEYIQREMNEHTRMHRITLLVTCAQDNCHRHIPVAFSHSGSRLPFLELQTQRPESEQFDTRRKRSKVCSPGSTSESECCMATLYVNFTEIGWHTWILQPRGYRTGYCKGRCMSTATRNFNAIMRAIIQRRRERLRHPVVPKPAPFDPDMAPCCSPVRMLPLEILFAKVENNHEQLSTAVLPSMIVDSCKC